MIRKIKKLVSVMAAAVIAISMWSAPVYADSSIPIEFKLKGVTLVSGDATWSGEQDYVAVFDIPEGYEIYVKDTAANKVAGGKVAIAYSLDEETGELVISKDRFNSEYQSIDIMLYAYDTNGTFDVLCDLPEGVTVKSGTIGEGAGKLGQDYTVTFEYSGDSDASLTVSDVYIVKDDSGYTPAYSFDEQTGVFTVSAADNEGHHGLKDAKEMTIYLMFSKDFDYDADVTKVDIPYEQTFTIGDAHTKILIDGYEEYYISKFYELELAEGESAHISLIGTDVGTDTRMFILKPLENGEFECVEYIDEDVRGYGEIAVFTADEASEYVILATCYDDEAGDEVTIKIAKNFEIAESLDFTADTLPVPSEGDLWAYDEASKTLTLKDGFSLSATDCGVVLPDGATIKVEGKADIIADDYTSDAICALGDITIDMSKSSKLSLSGYTGIFAPAGKITVNGTADSDGNKPELVISAEYGILIDGGYGGHNQAISGKQSTVALKNIDLDITGYEGIYTIYGALDAENCNISMDTSEECILLNYYDYMPDEISDVTIKNSTLDLTSGEEVIQSYIGDVVLENCDTTLITNDEEGIYTHYDIIIKKGKLSINSSENCLESAEGRISLENVDYILNLSDEDGGEYDIIASYDVSISGQFAVYDRDMNVLYKGTMTDEIKAMFEEQGSFVFYDQSGEFIYPMIVSSVSQPPVNVPTGSSGTTTGGVEVVITPDGNVEIPDSDTEDDKTDTTPSDDTTTDDTTDNTQTPDEDTNPDMGVKPAFAVMLLAVSAMAVSSKKKR